VVLDGSGTQQSRGDSPQWVISDKRGTGTAWTLSVSASDFVSAAGTVDLVPRTIASSNLWVIPGTVTRGANTNLIDQLMAPATQLSGSTHAVIWSPGSNSGTYFVSPTYSLLIPAAAFRPNYSGEIGNSPVNAYTATLTFTIG
jgi:hypothetical protein